MEYSNETETVRCCLCNHDDNFYGCVVCKHCYGGVVCLECSDSITTDFITTCPSCETPNNEQNKSVMLSMFLEELTRTAYITNPLYERLVRNYKQTDLFY